MVVSPRGSPIAPSAAVHASRTRASLDATPRSIKVSQHIVVDAAPAHRTPTPLPRPRSHRGHEHGDQRHAGAMPGDHLRPYGERMAPRRPARHAICSSVNTPRRTKRTETQFSSHGVAVGERALRGGCVAAVSGDGDLPPRERSFLEHVRQGDHHPRGAEPDQGRGDHAGDNGHTCCRRRAPTPVATSSRRRCSGASSSITGRPTRARFGQQGACRIGRSSGRLTPPCRNECHNGKDGDPNSSDGEFPGRHARINVIEPRTGVRSPSRRHLFWAIPLAVIGFAGVLAVVVTAAAAQHARRQQA